MLELMTLLDRRIRFSGSGCQNSGKARRAIADKLPYYTGGGTAELTHLTAKGREIIAASDMPNLLARLGPVLGGTAPVPSAAGVGLQDGDFDAINVPGVYTIAGSWTNGPIASSSTTALLAVTRRVYDNLYYQALYWGTSAYRRMTTVVGGLSWPNPWYAVESQRPERCRRKAAFPPGR
ncbi:hypothetical protein GOC40_11525 [Sinorhizobium meliloti]|nr:hypothetical protein [Sinorhizobium meliloti]